MATTIPSSDPSAFLAALMAENEALKAKAAAGKRSRSQYDKAVLIRTSFFYGRSFQGIDAIYALPTRWLR